MIILMRCLLWIMIVVETLIQEVDAIFDSLRDICYVHENGKNEICFLVFFFPLSPKQMKRKRNCGQPLPMDLWNIVEFYVGQPARLRSKQELLQYTIPNPMKTPSRLRDQTSIYCCGIPTALCLEYDKIWICQCDTCSRITSYSPVTNTLTRWDLLRQNSRVIGIYRLGNHHFCTLGRYFISIFSVRGIFVRYFKKLRCICVKDSTLVVQKGTRTFIAGLFNVYMWNDDHLQWYCRIPQSSPIYHINVIETEVEVVTQINSRRFIRRVFV